MKTLVACLTALSLSFCTLTAEEGNSQLLILSPNLAGFFSQFCKTEAISSIETVGHVDGNEYVIPTEEKEHRIQFPESPIIEVISMGERAVMMRDGAIFEFGFLYLHDPIIQGHYEAILDELNVLECEVNAIFQLGDQTFTVVYVNTDEGPLHIQLRNQDGNLFFHFVLDATTCCYFAGKGDITYEAFAAFLKSNE